MFFLWWIVSLSAKILHCSQHQPPCIAFTWRISTKSKAYFETFFFFCRWTCSSGSEKEIHVVYVQRHQTGLANSRNAISWPNPNPSLFCFACSGGQARKRAGCRPALCTASALSLFFHVLVNLTHINPSPQCTHKKTQHIEYIILHGPFQSDQTSCWRTVHTDTQNFGLFFSSNILCFSIYFSLWTGWT